MTMKNSTSFILIFSFIILAAISICGCRREDIREVTITIPGLTAENKALVETAFWIPNQHGGGGRYYDGIDLGSFKFDLEKKTLTMKYDSMKIAHTNLRMLIQAKGIAVEFPENRNGQK